MSDTDNSDKSQNLGLAVFVCCAASVIEFATTADECNSDDNCDHKRIAWALACGVISAVLCFLRILLIKFKPELPAIVDTVLSIFLTVWWVFGTAFNTSSKGPFNSSGNGYFSTWAAFFASVVYLAVSVSQVSAATKAAQGPAIQGTLLLLIASVVELGVSCDYYHEQHDAFSTKKKHRVFFAIALGVISSVACLVLLLLFVKQLGPHEMIGKVMAVFLLAWWAAGAGVNTSHDGPFEDSCNSANGYFSSWIGFFSAVYFCFYAFNPKGESESYDALA